MQLSIYTRYGGCGKGDSHLVYVKHFCYYTNMDIVSWDNKYDTGIELIDNQHKRLVDLTNELYSACMTGDKHLSDIFRDAMSRMVEYVQHHFNTELEFFNKVHFPDKHNHIMMHDELIQNILTAAKDYKENKKFVPNNFVRTLIDWIFSHIAVHDKNYALYVKEQIRLGHLTYKQLHEIEASLKH